MLIIEGTDCVGKTTFCKLLLKDPRLSSYWYRHLSRPPAKADFCNCYRRLQMRDAVYDRFHMSEIMYAQVRNEQPGLTPEAYRLVDARLRELGAYTVVITSCPDLLREKIQSNNHEQMYSPRQVLAANENFNSVVNGQVGKYQIDWDAHIHLLPRRPWCTDVDAEKIVDEYCVRQTAINQMLIGRLPRRGSQVST